jgi:hypothetical protein
VRLRGAGPAPLPDKQFTCRLTERLADLARNEGHRRGAAKWGTVIRQEDGARNTIRVIEALRRSSQGTPAWR